MIDITYELAVARLRAHGCVVRPLSFYPTTRGVGHLVTPPGVYRDRVLAFSEPPWTEVAPDNARLLVYRELPSERGAERLWRLADLLDKPLPERPDADIAASIVTRVSDPAGVLKRMVEGETRLPTKAVCVYCRRAVQPVIVWTSGLVDWEDNGDSGCHANPENDDSGTGGHLVREAP